MHCLDRTSRYDVRAVCRLAELYRETEVDLVHAHSSSLFIAAAAALLRPSPLVYHEHFGWSERIDDVTPWLVRPFSGLLCGVLVVNDLLCAYMRRFILGSEGRVLFLRNFTKQRLSKPIGREGGRDSMRIICMANFRPQKDHHTLIRAISKLRTLGVEECDFVFLGRYDPDDVYYKSVLEEIATCDLTDCVSVIQSITDVDAYLSTCDIGVLASQSEGLPLTLLEYAKCNLAVVSTNVGQCAEVLNYGRAGLLVSPGDDDALASAMKLLIESPETRTRLATALHANVEQKYSPEAVIPVMLMFYHAVRSESMLA